LLEKTFDDFFGRNLWAIERFHQFSLTTAVPKVWVVTQTWVAKGRKMCRAKVIQICQNETYFFSFFKFFQFRQRLYYCMIPMSFGFVLLKLDYRIISGFPRVLMAALLLAVTSC